MNKLASIVIVTCNRLFFSKQTIESVLNNTKYANYEVIIIDNGSTDGTVKYLKSIERRPHIRRVIYLKTNHGKGKAANQGFLISKGDYIVGLDDDVVAPKGWLTKMVKAIDLIPNVGWLSFNLERPYWRSFSRDRPESVFRPEYERKFGQFTVQTVPAVAGFCVAMPRSTYQKLGGYTEKAYYGGVDGEYNCRAKKAGLLTGYLMDVVGIHYGGSSEEKKLYHEYQCYKIETQKLLWNGNYNLAKINFFDQKRSIELSPEVRKMGKLIKGERPAVYFLYNGFKHLIPSLEAFKKLKFRWENLAILPQAEIDRIPSGQRLEV